MQLSKLKRRIKKIKKKGFIRSHRRHNTGIGKTLEDLLGIEENNLSVPDIGEVELKAQREGSKAMISLTTKAPKPRGVTRKLFEAYKYKDDEGKFCLHSPIRYSSPNNQGLKLDFGENDKLILANPNDIEAYWLPSIYKEIIKKKANKLLLVLAETTGKQKSRNEKFYYKKAVLLEGLTKESIKSAIKEDELLVELRIGVYRSGEKKGGYHDHGTAFRVLEKDIDELYDKKEVLVSSDNN